MDSGGGAWLARLRGAGMLAMYASRTSDDVGPFRSIRCIANRGAHSVLLPIGIAVPASVPVNIARRSVKAPSDVFCVGFPL